MCEVHDVYSLITIEVYVKRILLCRFRWLRQWDVATVARLFSMCFTPSDTAKMTSNAYENLVRDYAPPDPYHVLSLL